MENGNSGNLFKNDKTAPGSNPNWPDYKGQCEIDGKFYWISSWIKTGRPGTKHEGQKFMSLSFKPKDAPVQQPATQTTTHYNPPALDPNDAPPF